MTESVKFYMTIAAQKDSKPGKFHRDTTCPHLTRFKTPYSEIDIDCFPTSMPCTRCFRDMPRPPKTRHALCAKAKQPILKPCQHNGGVLVEIDVAKAKAAGTGFTHMRGSHLLRYVWPEDVWRYNQPKIVEWTAPPRPKANQKSLPSR
jgi:hypothetical protein